MTDTGDTRLNEAYHAYIARWRETNGRTRPDEPSTFSAWAEGWHARLAASKASEYNDPEFEILRDELNRAWSEVDRAQKRWHEVTRWSRLWRRQAESMRVSWTKAGYRPEDGPAYKRIMNQRAELRAREKENAYLRGVIQQLQERLEVETRHADTQSP